MADSNFRIYTVEEITLYIKHKLGSDKNLLDIWVQGEISNFVHHTSGHYYFTLKDERSQLPCAMFRWANETLKFKLEDGMKVIARGNIDVYTPQGRYNFVASEVHPKGIGELYLRFLQLKKRLAKEGLFDVKFKKPIPRFPNRVAVITSPTGAAIHDIVDIMKRRFPCAEVLIIPTLVQGENAKEDIASSIQILNKAQDVDVAIVGRGGGSIEDLWPFNEEMVARAIFESEVPIISAVGHESDFTISDFVADLRAATPSAAAELVVPDKKEIIGQINSLKDAMFQNLISIMRLHKKHIEGVSAALRPKLILDRIIQYQQRTDDLTSSLTMQMKHYLDICSGRFNALSEMLDAVSPLATLKRGYSITLKLPDEYTIDSVEKVKEGDDIRIILRDGALMSNVSEIERGEKGIRIKGMGNEKDVNKKDKEDN